MKTQEEIKSNAVVWFGFVEALQAFQVLAHDINNRERVNSSSTHFISRSLQHSRSEIAYRRSAWIENTIKELQYQLLDLINAAPELLGEVAEDSDVEFYKTSGEKITREEIEIYAANGYAEIEGNIRIVYGDTFADAVKSISGWYSWESKK